MIRFIDCSELESRAVWVKDLNTTQVRASK